MEFELEKIIKDLKSLQLKLKLTNTTCKRVGFQTQLKFKEWLNDNFEFTNDDKDFIFCSEFTRFCLRHYSEPLTSSQFECMMNQIIPSKTKKFGSRSFKIKCGIKPKKLDFEFNTNVRNKNFT